MKNNLITAEEVKNALGIDSFRNLSKDKVMEFVSLIPSMDKDLAMQIVEQFPSYAEYSQNIVSGLNQLCEKALEKNEVSSQKSIEAYQTVLNSLSELLQQEYISVDERKYITEKMIEVADKVAVKDSENKEFIEKVIKYGGYVAAGALILGAAILGVNIKGKDIPRLN